MPSHDGPSLADLLLTVPDLLPSHILAEWPLPVDGIKKLRLLSKEIGAIAGALVKSCTVQLGHDSLLEAEQVARVVNQSQLQRMVVKVEVCEGDKASSVAHQASACAQGMSRLLSGAETAIKSITHLQLNVTRNDLSAKHDDYFARIPTHSPTLPTNPPNIHLVSRPALSMLAAAVPHLTHLTLRTNYGDVDLAKYGSRCTKLSHLDIESASAQFLQGIDLALPNLTHLSFSTTYQQQTWSITNSIKEYAEAACLLMRGCSNLTSLQLSFHQCGTGTDEVECPSEMWEQLPASLVEWHCRVDFPRMFEAGLFMGRVQVLSVNKLPDVAWTVPDLLKLAPQLRKLSVAGWGEPTRTQTELMWADDITLADLNLLKTRLLGGLKLLCDRVCFTGTGSAVRDMQSWYSPLVYTSSCFIFLAGMGYPLDSLDQLARVCPIVDHLYLGDKEGSPWGQGPQVSKRLLTPVMACTHLQRLDVNLPVKFTHAGLVELCVGLPELHTLYCRPCVGVSFQLVMKDIATQGQEVSIIEIVEGEDTPDPYASY